MTPPQPFNPAATFSPSSFHSDQSAQIAKLKSANESTGHALLTALQGEVRCRRLLSRANAILSISTATDENEAKALAELVSDISRELTGQASSS